MSGFAMAFDLVMRYGTAFCVRPKIDPSLLGPEYNGYHVLDGQIPDGKPSIWSKSPLLRAVCDPGCTECGGNPKCGGGGPPPAEELVKQVLGSANTILIAPTVTFEGGYLQDTRSGLRVPVLEPSSADELPKALESWHSNAKLAEPQIAEPQVAYHVYLIGKIVSESPNLKDLSGKWLAIPVPCTDAAQPPAQ